MLLASVPMAPRSNRLCLWSCFVQLTVLDLGGGVEVSAGDDCSRDPGSG